MRSPRLIYLAVAVVLAVAGFALTQYLADRSSPGLGDTVVVVPAGSGTAIPPSPSASPSPSPTAAPPSTPGAEQVTPGTPRTAGDDDDKDDDGIDDDLDDTVDGDD
ncbi:hypothetical protein ACQPXM_01405 [Kribbella sp. CA-253562]|uniref:hypothetical protein n=1 Tax=Kribbella sp. CA-253562 TaxID=3239942 RepID=UPI003D9298A1